MTFHDLADAPISPAIPQAEHLERWPLQPLMIPRTLYFGGVACDTEMVKLDNLVAWRERNGLEFVETAFVARIGRVNVYWPADSLEAQP